MVDTTSTTKFHLIWHHWWFVASSSRSICQVNGICFTIVLDILSIMAIPPPNLSGSSKFFVSVFPSHTGLSILLFHSTLSPDIIFFVLFIISSIIFILYIASFAQVLHSRTWVFGCPVQTKCTKKIVPPINNKTNKYNKQ